tara:strand:- start:99 stop:329 length:231 start_codon:yes stop_codon:yes gene_type:complete
MGEAYNIGDLILFESDTKTNDYSRSGVIIQRVQFKDTLGVSQEYLVVHWSDDSVGFIQSETFIQITVLSKTGSKNT